MKTAHCVRFHVRVNSTKKSDSLSMGVGNKGLKI